MVFRQIDRAHCKTVELQSCISSWSGLLLQHVHREVSEDICTMILGSDKDYSLSVVKC